MSRILLHPAEELRVAIRIVADVIDHQKRIPEWQDDSQFMPGIMPPRKVVEQLRAAQKRMVDAMAMVKRLADEEES